MECEKCGAEISSGAGTCPVCGEPVAAAAEADTVNDTAPARPTRDAKGGSRARLFVGVLVAVLVIAALAGAGWYAYKQVGSANSPEGAATAMLKAYAVYDAQGILDTATHKSLPADGVKEFEKQAAEAKTRSGGKPGVKDYKITKVTKNSDDQATVEIEAQWLTDPAKGTYTKRSENLTIVRQDGKWLVKLF